MDCGGRGRPMLYQACRDAALVPPGGEDWQGRTDEAGLLKTPPLCGQPKRRRRQAW